MIDYYDDNYDGSSACPSYISHASTATTKTSVSSKYTTFTEGSEVEKISFIIGVKLVLVIITLIPGAILALLINVWMYKHKVVVPPDSKIFPADDIETNGPMPYCQYQNEQTKLCLDDMQADDPLSQRPVYLYHCHSFFAASQFFHHSKDEDGTISKPRYLLEMSQERMCLDSNDLHVVLDICVVNKGGQLWTRRSQRLHTLGDMCLTAIGNGEPVVLEPCSDLGSQFWKCLKVEKEERLFNKHYQERNLSYHDEL